jgi:1-acyl-sn-glycerol-3-phosphate acyltransferase
METDYYVLHRILVRIASWAVYSFFTEVRVIGGENVPANGPIIVYVSLPTKSELVRDCQ